MTEALRLADVDTLVDLSTFVGRARRADPGGAIRLVGHGDVLAAYVSPVHGGGGPVVLGLRTLHLGAPSTLDVTVPLASLADVLSRQPGDDPVLAMPAAQAAGVAWAGLSPPRRGWRAVGAVDSAVLSQRASSGIAEVAMGAPSGSGAAAVSSLRVRVWGRELTESLPGLPAGVAFAAMALGFVDAAAPAGVYRSGPWWRVSTSSGHLLARRPALPVGL